MEDVAEVDVEWAGEEEQEQEDKEQEDKEEGCGASVPQPRTVLTGRPCVLGGATARLGTSRMGILMPASVAPPLTVPPGRPPAPSGATARRAGEGRGGLLEAGRRGEVWLSRGKIK